MKQFPGTLVLASIFLSMGVGCISSRVDVTNDPAQKGRDPEATRQPSARYKDLKQHTFYRIGAVSDPEVDAKNRILYFASTHDTPDYNLYVKSFRRGAVIRLTSDSGNERSPRLSPDGRWLAYTSDRNKNWDIFLLDLTQPEATPKQLTQDASDELAPSWSPDGTEIYFTAFSHQSGKWKIWRYDLSSRQTIQVGTEIDGLFPRPSPEGHVIAFHRFRNRTPAWASLWTIRPNGTVPTEILTRDTWAAITPTWSPDGQNLAFSTVAKSLERRLHPIGADDIWTLRRDGTELQQITEHPASDWSPTWIRLPGEERIFFASDRSGTSNIWSIRVR